LSVRPEWKPYLGKAPLYDRHMVWHEPLVLFGYLAALTRSLELCTGILISPQRQSALLAKQAAEADVLTGGRIRFVIAAGWNDVEYEALGIDFKNRGKIMEEQVELMRLLWTQEVVSYSGKFHKVTAAGINPLPVQRPIPLWFGGQSPIVLRRAGRLADGWFPYYPWFHPEQLEKDRDALLQAAREAGRDPKSIGIEGAIYFADPRFEIPPGGRKPPKDFDECVEYARWWKKFGATRYWVTAPWADLGPEETGVRTKGKKWSGVEARLRALGDFKKALGADF
ncbi:MAG TPA: TIGR03619 family F420-dependent LLM class oxidoreductase, partial [Myxococcota bacterium]|nr:TIGR03619 family F420-dependent LLM class oxidoreductase [Myxococcota bacterium]